MIQFEGPLPDFWMHVGNQPGCEKISFGGIATGEHYTIIWHKSLRKVDVHKTYDDPAKPRELIFEISFFAFNRLVAGLKNIDELYARYYFSKSITIEGLQKKNLLMHPMQGFGDEREQWMMIKDRKLRTRKNRPTNSIITFLEPREAAFYRHCHWQLYDSDYRWKGFVYQKAKESDELEFFYVSKYRYDRFRKAVRELLKAASQNVRFYNKYEVF